LKASNANSDLYFGSGFAQIFSILGSYEHMVFRPRLFKEPEKIEV